MDLLEKDLKKLNRREILMMLISLTQRSEELQKNIDETNTLIRERYEGLSEYDSIADALIKLNGLESAMNNAGEEYINILKARYKHLDEENEQKLIETRNYCIQIESESKQRCDDMLQSAKQESQAYWDEIEDWIKKYNDTKASLMELTGSMSEL